MINVLNQIAPLLGAFVLFLAILIGIYISMGNYVDEFRFEDDNEIV